MAALFKGKLNYSNEPHKVEICMQSAHRGKLSVVSHEKCFISMVLNTILDIELLKSKPFVYCLV